MADNAADFDAILQFVNQKTGVDFTCYKRPSLMRCLEKRMQALEIVSLASYSAFLEAHTDEIVPLLRALLINVTSFFRDPVSWDYLTHVAVPRLLESAPPDKAVRIWSAGCASGCEAYSLAMLFAEVLGMDEFRRRVKIYGTDLDEEEVNYARRASYSERQMASVPDDLRAKYFTPQGGRWNCSKDLRRSAIFARHDLLRDAPISHIDLLCCRNTLMYFNAEGQAKTLARLHFAVRDGGILFLGKAEMLAAYSSLFVPMDLKRRVFVKVNRPGERERRRFVVESSRKETPLEALLESRQTMMQDMVFDGGMLAQVLVDASGTVTMINEQARALFGLTPHDVGRPLRDLEMSYRPADLRSLIDAAYEEKRSKWVGDIPWMSPQSDTALSLDLTVVPLLDAEQSPLGVTVTFANVTPQKQVQNDLHKTIRELETAYEELQSTNEELETTYEELQSTIEELDTTNEELQSTNEELETMNEELQFTNEELQTINGEVSQRGQALDEANAFMQSILRSFQAGVAVLDQDLLVEVWNAGMEDLWGLRAEEAQGSHFWNLDIGLPVERLKQPLRAILGGQDQEEALLLPSHNRKGREIICRVVCMPLLGADNSRKGIILLMEQQPPAEAQRDGKAADGAARDGKADVVAEALRDGKGAKG